MRNTIRNLAGAIVLTLVFATGATFGGGDAAPFDVGHPLSAVATSDENTAAARLVIKGPTKGVVGELIRLDVSNSCGQSFKWLLVPESVDFEVYDNGRRAVFSARKTGKYMFIMACALEDTVDVATHIVTIVKPGEPDPNKEYPKVDKPIAGSDLAKMLPYWCSLAKREREEALALAESFEGIAAAIAAGAYTTPEEISKATGDANRTALKTSLDSWLPVLSKLQTELRRRSNIGELKTPEQHAEAWREIAEGLLAYASMFNLC
jgi:hypothetical protein